MKSFSSDELSIEVSEAAGLVTVAWLGTSDARDPGQALSPFLSELAQASTGKRVQVDFRRLEYMNSATVSPIIQFSKTLDELGIESTLLFDSKVGWQRVNYVCLKNIAKTLKNVSVEG